MASKGNEAIKVMPNDSHEMVRQALWGLIKGISAQRTFCEMLEHSKGMEEGAEPNLEEVAHMVYGMAERLDLHLNHVKGFVFDQIGRGKP